MIHLLFILLVGSGGNGGVYGFTTEFHSAAACEYAAEQARKSPYLANAFCAPQGEPETAKQVQAAESRQRAAHRARPARRVAAERPYWNEE